MISAYFRLTKPGIIRANVITAAAGFLFASRGDVDITRLIATLIGTALVIACGCVLNNYVDRGIDKKMDRTHKRALVTGAISPQSAIKFAGVLGITGIIILAAFTNFVTVLIGLLAVIFYVVVYGYAKRYTNFATEIGTLPGAASIVAGYTAVTGSLDAPAACLFLVLALWQLPHFWAISIFRAGEYEDARISVLPHRIGFERTQKRILVGILAYSLSTVLLAIYSNTSLTYLFVVTGSGLFWLYIGLNGYTVEETVAWAKKMFRFSLIILLIFCVMISVDHWLS